MEEVAIMLKTEEKGITFAVHPVEPVTSRLYTRKTRDTIEALLRGNEEKEVIPILSCSGYNSDSVGAIKYHGLFAAVHLAFSEHRPLVLSPDMIWTTIMQGVSTHVKNNAERLRSKLVNHAGKLRIGVARDDIFESSPETAWDSVVHDLSGELLNHINSSHQNLISNFSTTGEIEKTVSEIALLDTFEPYFEYVVYCICGIPEITLEGVPNDWKLLREKIELLTIFELDFWLPHLRTIADHFERASRGDVDLEHWQNIYKVKEAYGSDRCNGWIAKLIPYLRANKTGSFTQINRVLNDDVKKWDEQPASYMNIAGGLTSDELPCGISQVPFKLVHADGREVPMQFLGGFVGVEQEKSGRIRPKLGWAVRKAPSYDVIDWELPGFCEARQPLSSSEFDTALDAILGTDNDWSLDTIPADLLSFYRKYDGMTVKTKKGKCNLRSLKDVEKVPAPEKLVESMQTALRQTKEDGYYNASKKWLKVYDTPDGRYVLIQLTQYKDDSAWRACLVNTRSGKSQLIAPSFSQFIRRLIESDGELPE
jgi:Domain of unknown function (DUF4419)